MNEDGAPLPDLTGSWAAESTAQSWTLQLYQPPRTPAVPPNSTYAVRRDQLAPVSAVCSLTAVYDYETRRPVRTDIHCEGTRDNGLQTRGRVVDNSTLEWDDSWRWLRKAARKGELFGRYSAVHKVHVVFMNHYDVGYTDFVNGVDNVYMHKYFGLAERTAQSFRANGSDAFIYTTHPWLMQRFIDCPCPTQACLATSLNNTFEPALKCPSAAELAGFAHAVALGDIVWNAAPFNIQPENMSPELFRAAFDLTRRMDQRFRRNQTKTMSIRDVIYVTRSVLPHLRDLGVTGLTVGSNGADYPPQVPKLHRWVDEDTGADVVVAYHPFGYGGFGLKDCAEAPNGVALCSEFRTDNTGPPSSVKEVEETLNTVRHEYPGAVVKASTFDAFFADVAPVKDQLPVVKMEVGDTWTYGTPSDPLKMAQHRAVQRVWLQCLRRGDSKCALDDPAIQNFTFFMMKAPEHTWGTPGISGWGQGGDYNTSLFRSHLSNQTYMKAAASWAEQRVFNELAVRSLEEAAHPLAAEARAELQALSNVSAPDLTGFQEVAKDSVLTLVGGLEVGFREDGAINMLRGPRGLWASGDAALAAFVYQTFNDTEWRPFTYSYLNDHQMQTGFCKPGSNNFSESAVWRPRLTRLMVKAGPGAADRAAAAAEAVVAIMDMPQRAWTLYGSPQTLYLTVRPDGGGLALELATLQKQPTMIGEATLLTFRPAPALMPFQSGSAWRLDKLGQWIDPKGVLQGGNQYTHGVWQGTKVQTENGVMSIESLDAANMNPMTAEFPNGNPLPASYREEDARAGTGLSPLASGSVRGMAVNLHNNLWNTNYPLFYPYFDPQFCSGPLECSNSNALFRFRLTFEATDSIVV